jgi:hypothetical protein
MLLPTPTSYGVWGALAFEKERLHATAPLRSFPPISAAVVDDIEDPAKADKERTKLNAVRTAWATFTRCCRPARA